jgi:hypothetical protein
MSCATGSRPAWNTSVDSVAANEGENMGPELGIFSGAGEGRDMSGAVEATVGAPREDAVLAADPDVDVRDVGGVSGRVEDVSVIGVAGPGRRATAASRLGAPADSVSRGVDVEGA